MTQMPMIIVTVCAQVSFARLPMWPSGMGNVFWFTIIVFLIFLQYSILNTIMQLLYFWCILKFFFLLKLKLWYKLWIKKEKEVQKEIALKTKSYYRNMLNNLIDYIRFFVKLHLLRWLVSKKVNSWTDIQHLEVKKINQIIFKLYY